MTRCDKDIDVLFFVSASATVPEPASDLMVILGQLWQGVTAASHLHKVAASL
jgi:hypothetical protein